MARELYALTEQDRRELRDMRRRVNGAHGSRRPVPTRRRVAGGSGGGSALVSDALDRTCLTTKAINFSGREIPPGHWGWVETDANELDLGQAYPAGFVGGITIVETKNGLAPNASDNNWSLVDLDADVQDNDLVVIRQYRWGAIQTNTHFSGTLGTDYRVTSDTTSNYATLVLAWGSTLTDKDKVPVGSSTDATVRAEKFYQIAVLRGVTRHEGNGFLDEDVQSSLVRNGLHYMTWSFVDGATAPRLLLDNGGYHTQQQGLGTNYSSQTSGGTATSSGSDPANYAFPAGTYFLVSHGSNESSTTSFNVSDAYPSYSVVKGDQTQGNNTTAGGLFLYGPLNAAGPPPVAAIIEDFDEVDNLGSGVFPDPRKFDYLYIYPLFSGATPSSLPNPTCNPLVLRDPPREAGFTAETAKAKSEARKALDAARLWRPVLAKAAIGDQSSGQVVWGGVSQGWIYRRNLTDRYAGMAPENTTRTEIYDTAIGDEVGRLGRYYKRLKQGGDDPRLAYFFGRPDLLFSQSQCGPVEILKWGRDVAETAAITVTLNATRTAATASQLTGTYTSYTLSTGAAVTFAPAQPWTVAIPQTELLLLLDLIGGGTSGNLTIDLGQDGGASPPLYGDEVANVLRGESTAGRFEWWLLYNRTLIVYPKLTPWQAVADGGSLSDTIVFAGSSGDPVYSSYAPWIFADPVDHPASFAALSPTATFADWPEAIPAVPGQVPTGSNLVADATYDPYYGRSLGKDADGVDLSESDPLYETDQRLGLQLAVFRFLDHCPGGSSGGGCC